MPKRFVIAFGDDGTAGDTAQYTQPAAKTIAARLGIEVKG